MLAGLYVPYFPDRMTKLLGPAVDAIAQVDAHFFQAVFNPFLTFLDAVELRLDLDDALHVFLTISI